MDALYHILDQHFSCQTSIKIFVLLFSRQTITWKLWWKTKLNCHRKILKIWNHFQFSTLRAIGKCCSLLERMPRLQLRWTVNSVWYIFCDSFFSIFKMIKSLPACFAVKVADSWFWGNAIESKCLIFYFFISLSQTWEILLHDRYMDLNFVLSWPTIKENTVST